MQPAALAVHVGASGLTLTVLDRLADYLGLTLCGRASR